MLRPGFAPLKTLGLIVLVSLGAFGAILVIRVISTRHASTSAPLASSLQVGSRAPGFTLPRLGGGRAVSLATAHGEPVIVNFFASWSPGSRQELRAIASVALAAAGKVATIGVDTTETQPAAAKRMLAETGSTYPVGVDPAGHLAAKYQITGVPVIFFLSASDRVEHVTFGRQTTKTLSYWVGRLDARRTPSS